MCFIINLKWQEIEFSCGINASVIKLNLLSSFLVENELTMNLVNAKYIIVLYKYLAKIFPQLILLGSGNSVGLSEADLQFSFPITDCKEFFFDNSPLIITNNSEDLGLLQKQIFIKHELVHLPVCNVFSGEFNFNLFENEYLIKPLEFQFMVLAHPVFDDYLLVSLEYSGKPLSLYLSRNIITYFVRVLFMNEVNLLQQDSNVIYMILDLIICFLNTVYGLGIVLYDFSYQKLNLHENYYKFSIANKLDGFNSNICVSSQQVLTSLNDLSGLFKKNENLIPVISQQTSFQFPLYCGETYLNLLELDSLVPGEVIMLDTSYLGLKDLDVQQDKKNAVLDFGNTKLLVGLCSDSQIQIIDKL